MRSGVQLITYADRFGGGDLSTIQSLLTGPLAGVFTGVHLLPYYLPFDGADAGFDPVDHGSVDPRLGDWNSVRRISETHDVMSDLIVNHISSESAQFRDFIQLGDGSAYAGMFLTYDSVFPAGASAEDLLRIYRPRPGLPFTPVVMADGSRRLMWTTFTDRQIDLASQQPATRTYLLEILDRLAAAGVGQIRLDAIGYAVKTPGTSSFMTSETMAFIDDIGREVRARGMESLFEIHTHFSDQIKVAATVDRVYDFALPPLVLYALYTGSAAPLTRWLKIAPRNTITVLDTHDGIGVIDVGAHGDREGLLTAAQINEVVEGIHSAGNGAARQATGAAASNLDLYQVNSTYYSALGGDDDRYLTARLIQFMSPGAPQVYYAGLMAAPNDVKLLKKSGVGRDINRPYFSRDQIDAALERPVVRSLLDLARFRNTHPAFGGSFHLGDGGPNELVLVWSADTASIRARIDLATPGFVLEHTIGAGSRTIVDWDGFAAVS